MIELLKSVGIFPEDIGLGHVAQLFGGFTAQINSQMSVVVLGTLFLLIAESRYPAISYRRTQRIHSTLTNLALFLLNSTALSFLTITATLDYARLEGIYLPDATGPRSLAEWIGMVFMMDFFLYAWHIANHRIPLLWMFHKVHHSDECVNVSTAFRFHAGELVVTVIYKAGIAIWLGITEAFLLVSQTVTFGFVMFHHANVSIRHERLISAVFIVPSLHRTHHSACRRQHDKNFGSILSIWDRLFQTLETDQPDKIGLDHVKQLSLWETLVFGMRNHTSVTPKNTGVQPSDSPNNYPIHPIENHLIDRKQLPAIALIDLCSEHCLVIAKSQSNLIRDNLITGIHSEHLNLCWQISDRIFRNWVTTTASMPLLFLHPIWDQPANRLPWQSEYRDQVDRHCTSRLMVQQQHLSKQVIRDSQ